MIDDDEVIRKLEKALGAERVLTGDSVSSYGTTGFTPFVVAVPDDRFQAAEVVRIAAESHVGIMPRGGGTKWGWEPAPTTLMIGLSTVRLGRVIQHEPRDLTITVEAGMVLGQLNGLLKDHRQRLSIDPPHGGSSTIGGICATNDSGPLRYRYGTMRDLVVGMEVIDAQGIFTRSGGRVVKNAAGYGMYRLHIGAMGTLGVMTEMTLRLQPLSEAFRLAVVRCADGDEAEANLAAVMAGRTRPVLIELVRHRGDGALTHALGGGDWHLVLGFEDCREAVDWQCEHVRTALAAPVDILDEDESEKAYGVLREWPGRSAVVSFKATMTSSQVAVFVAWAGDRGFDLLSHAGNGIVYGQSNDPTTLEAADDLAALAADGAGQIAWRSLPPNANVELWQPVRADLAMMRRIKQRFDPVGIFSPGRWVDVM